MSNGKWVHPWYGACDEGGYQGRCSECEALKVYNAGDEYRRHIEAGRPAMTNPVRGKIPSARNLASKDVENLARISDLGYEGGPMLTLTWRDMDLLLWSAMKLRIPDFEDTRVYAETEMIEDLVYALSRLPPFER